MMYRYWGDEPGANVFDIYVDDIYKIPEEWTRGKSSLNISFRAKEGKRAGGLYELKITADPDYR